MTSFRRPRVELAVNANPRCRRQITSVLKGETWTFSNVPSVTLKGEGFPDGEQVVAVNQGRRPIAAGTVAVEAGRLAHTFELAAPLRRGRELEVRVGTAWCEPVPVTLRRLHGRVTTFDGRPVADALVRAADGACAAADAEGHFDLWLDRPTPHVSVWDDGYSVTNVETWLYDVRPARDTVVHPRIGSLEVYELGAWESYTGLYLHFIPISLSLLRAAVSRGVPLADLPAQADVWPHLASGDIRVHIGGRRVPIASCSEFRDCLAAGPAAPSRPGYVIGIARAHLQPGPVRVEVRCRPAGGGRPEMGEGHYLGRCGGNRCGAG